MQHDPGKGIDGNVGDIPLLHVRKLRLLIVGLDPDIASHQINDLHAGSDQLSLLHMTLADSPCRRGDNARISEIDFRDNDGGLFGLNVCPVHGVFRVQGGALSLLRFQHSAAAVERCLGPGQVCLAAG